MNGCRAAVLSIAPLGASGCVSRAPTIAHVHIGHAITGVHVTPNKEGYMVTAERRGAHTVDLAHRAVGSTGRCESQRATHRDRAARRAIKTRPGGETSSRAGGLWS